MIKHKNNDLTGNKNYNYQPWPEAQIFVDRKERYFHEKVYAYQDKN